MRGTLCLAMGAVMCACGNVPTEPIDITPAHIPYSLTVKLPEQPVELLTVLVGITDAADSFYQFQVLPVADTTWADTIYVPASIEYKWRGYVGGEYAWEHGFLTWASVDTIFIRKTVR